MSSPFLKLTDISDNQSAVDTLAASATRTLEIFTPDLEPEIYGAPTFLEAVTRLLTAHKNASARVLVQNPERAIKDGHLLVELSRRLSSRLHIRKTAAEHADHSEAFMIVDAQGYLQRPHADRYEGSAGLDDRVRARNLLTFFNHAWEHGVRESEFSRLHV